MAKLALFILLFSLFALNFLQAFTLNGTREEMLIYYQTAIEPKMPNTAKALLGDERINLAIGGKTLGIETRQGELYGFGFTPIVNPSITVAVSDAAAGGIAAKKLGILSAINNGGITVRTSNWYTALKVEMMKRIYAASGADDHLTGKRAMPRSLESYNAIYIQRAKITNSLFG